MKLLLARHGETDWNARGQIQGQSDPGLNETGRAQARALARRLEETGVPLRRLYTSPQKRSAETAAIVGACLGIEAEAVEGLREICFGVWEGHCWEEIAALWPHSYEAYAADRLRSRPPEGESYAELLEHCRRGGKRPGSGAQRRHQGGALPSGRGGFPTDQPPVSVGKRRLGEPGRRSIPIK